MAEAAGSAIWIDRRRINLVALAASTAFALYLVLGTPYFMDRQLYSDALGLAILEQAKREQELVAKAKKGLLVEPPAKAAPARLTNRPTAPRGKGGKAPADQGAEAAALYEQIGRLKMELEWLKKK